MVTIGRVRLNSAERRRLEMQWGSLATIKEWPVTQKNGFRGEHNGSYFGMVLTASVCGN